MSEIKNWTLDVHHDMTVYHLQFDPGKIVPLEDGGTYEYEGVFTIYRDDFSLVYQLDSNREVATFLMEHTGVTRHIIDAIDMAYARGFQDGEERIREGVQILLNVAERPPAPRPSYAALPEAYTAPRFVYDED